jgi:hypothetical protein
VGAVVSSRLRRVAVMLDVLVSQQLAGRSAALKLVLSLLAARGLIGADRGDA